MASSSTLQQTESLLLLPQDDVMGLSATHLDANVLAAFSNVVKVLNVANRGMSLWSKWYRITLELKNEEKAQYFMKVSIGHHGREALKGEFAATSAIHSAVPDFCPKPIAWGTFKSNPDAHFYVCKFYDFFEGLPKPAPFCRNLARLHSIESPNGKFGFAYATYNGDIPQDNTWCDSWEESFTTGLHHVLKLREERGGPDADLDAVLPPLFDTVIPRLLRPLETNGRKLKPSLIHGDLWCGNASIINKSSGEGIVYDPASFWAHNEYELGNWRPERNLFTQEYFKAYHSHIPRSEPKEDYDDRNALYALRFNLHAATLFPDDHSYVQMAIEEIQRLSEKFASD